jgi:hypothetical protein
VVYRIGHDKQKHILTMTECIMDTLDPNWVAQVLVSYVFEEVQHFEVAVFDKDAGDVADLSKHQLCGSTSFSLGSLMCSRGQALTLQLEGRSPGSTLKVRAEAVSAGNDVFECSFAGSKLANKDGFFGKSDPFLDISRVCEDGSFVHVHKTDKIMNDLSPTWPLLQISMQRLCNGDLDRPLRIEIFDWDSDGSHDSMGCVMASVRELMASGGHPMNVIEEKKKSKRGYVNSGTLSALHASVKKLPSFLEYISGGLEVSLSVAIDFTGSNGDPKYPNSLHHLGAVMNSYQQAILAVGSVLEPYDSDRQYPVYGMLCEQPVAQSPQHMY